MVTTFKEHEEKKAKSFKMMLWFAMISMAMVFAGLTSAYVVSKSRPDWLTDFEFFGVWPAVLGFLSSVATIIWRTARKEDDLDDGASL